MSWSKKAPKYTNSKAQDVKKRLGPLARASRANWVNLSRVFCFRSTGSKTRAAARIWGLNRIWQQALTEKPAYILEVISERFDHLSRKKQDEILIHELAHIPKNFSGALLPHTKKRKGSFHDKLKKMLAAYNRER
jgi:predicted metallopeptidase